MLFDDFKQRFPDVINCLIKARCSSRFAHAYLVHGDSHQLRKDFSLVLSMIAICPNLPQLGAPCGECPACSRLLNSTYSELYQLLPTGKMWIIPVGNPNNPEANTVRWFNDAFYLTSTSGLGKKIGIIFDADRMKSEAQNAFLKTLEEPPSDTFFILTSGNPLALLPTTRSRCQLITLLENNCQFDFIGSDKLFATLGTLQFKAQGNIALAEECVAELIRIAAGLKDAAEESVMKERQERLAAAEELSAAIKKRIIAQFDAAVSGEYIRLRSYFIAAIHSWFAQVYQLTTGADMATLANAEVFNGIEFPDHIAETDAFKALNQAEQLIYDLRFNVNEELALRSFGINLVVN
jgi:DNA polymerase-3 subunit delta'